MAAITETRARAQKRTLWETVAYKRLDASTSPASYDESLQIISAKDSRGKSLGVSLTQGVDLAQPMMLQARWSKRRVRIVVGHDEGVHSVNVSSAHKRVKVRGSEGDLRVEHASVRGGNAKLTVRGFIFDGYANSTRFWRNNRNEVNMPNTLTMAPSRAARKAIDVRTISSLDDNSGAGTLIASHDYGTDKPGTVVIYAGGGRRRIVATGRDRVAILGWSPKKR